MGDQIETPFRIIDEFDVFMDERSRKAALEMIISFTLRHAKNQFIFLTPHNLSAVDMRKHKDLVKIFRMRDPERGDAGD